MRAHIPGNRLFLTHSSTVWKLACIKLLPVEVSFFWRVSLDLRALCLQKFGKFFSHAKFFKP